MTMGPWHGERLAAPSHVSDQFAGGTHNVTVLRRLLPDTVSVDEVHGDDADVLYPQEAAHIARAVPKRQREFATVRKCARRALQRFDIERHPMVPGTAGAPAWPSGIVGSMTHCDEYRAAAVARAGDIEAVGIDAEPAQELPPGVLRTVASAAEIDSLTRLRHVIPGVAWDRLLFSAKESIYKVWYPLSHDWLGFEEADVELFPAGSFRAELARPLPSTLTSAGVRELWGRWGSDGCHVMTCVVLPTHLFTRRPLLKIPETPLHRSLGTQ